MASSWRVEQMLLMCADLGNQGDAWKSCGESRRADVPDVVLHQLQPQRTRSVAV